MGSGQPRRFIDRHRHDHFPASSADRAAADSRGWIVVVEVVTASAAHADSVHQPQSSSGNEAAKSAGLTQTLPF